MIRKIGGLKTYWDDAEFVLRERGPEAIFGQDTIPATWAKMQQCLQRIPHLSQSQSFLTPNRLVSLLYDSTKEHSTESTRLLWAYLADYPPTRTDEPTMAEQVMDLKAALASGEFDLHFDYFAFRIERCETVTTLTADSLFLHLADPNGYVRTGCRTS